MKRWQEVFIAVFAWLIIAGFAGFLLSGCATVDATYKFDPVVTENGVVCCAVEVTSSKDTRLGKLKISKGEDGNLTVELNDLNTDASAPLAAAAETNKLQAETAKAIAEGLLNR